MKRWLIKQVKSSLKDEGKDYSEEEISHIIDKFLGAITQRLEEYRQLKLRYFGTFKLKYIKPGLMWNPFLQRKVEVEKTGVRISFKPSATLKRLLAKKETPNG